MGSAEMALAIVQARMSSVRMPGKTLADVDGEPMLALLLRRLERARRIERIVVATSTDAVDDPIAQLALELGAGVSRGSREDVLGRFVGAIGDCQKPIVRVTGDCPLIDPRLVDDTFARFQSSPGCAYASNLQPRTFPDGLDVEVIDARALRAVDRERLSRSDREHVTGAIRAQPARFPQATLAGEQDLSQLRWTVDEPEDLAFVRAVVRRLASRRYAAGLAEILAAVSRAPALGAVHGARA
jgi:spore coat polysaccharide biosynthesis protein SpsF